LELLRREGDMRAGPGYMLPAAIAIRRHAIRLILGFLWRSIRFVGVKQL